MADSGGAEGSAGANKIRVVVIGGPTGSGKSSLAIELAQKYDAEIISADSRQIYRQLKIGTDRLDEEAQQGIRHHLMGDVDLDSRFTVFDFVERAGRIIEEIDGRGKRVIVCGGTGLYLRALIEGIYELPDEDLQYRSELLDRVAVHGVHHLHDILKGIDPEAAREIHPNNLVRVMRAIELYNITGLRSGQRSTLPTTRNEKLDFLQIILVPERGELYRKIEVRVDEMFARGLPEEVEGLYNSSWRNHLKDCKVVGYRELVAYLEGHIDLEEARNLIKQNTRRYAKRQYTWFRAVKEANFLKLFGNRAGAEDIKVLEDYLN